MYSRVNQQDAIQKKYIDILRKKKSKLFYGMNMQNILWNETFFCQKKYNILKMSVRTFVLSPKIDANIENNDLLCIYTKNYRTDHDQYWERIKEDSGRHDDITILSRDNFIDFFSVIKKIIWFFTFYKEFGKIIPRREKVYLSLQLVLRKYTLEKVKKYKLLPKIAMCFFDSSPDENVLMQYFRQIGAITVTNQHGQALFQSWEYDLVNQSQILNFKCDYYLAKGDMQIAQFEKAGFNKKQFLKLGIVGSNKSGYKKHDFKCFAVFLDCPSLPFADISNYKLIDMAKKIAHTMNMRYIVKTHPTELEGKYEMCVDGNCIEVCNKNIKLEEVFEKIDFGIIHASATYVDLYLYGLRCFRLKSEIAYPISIKEDEFENVDTICSLLQEWNNKEFSEQGSYINSVRKLYDDGWYQGKVFDILQSILKNKEKENKNENSSFNSN